MKVTVLGLGYIGLPTSIALAESGVSVTGFDIDKNKVTRINSMDPVISEPEVFSRLKNVITNKKFIATDRLTHSNTYIIAVPTPLTSDKKANLDYVWSAIELISKVIKKDDLIILESTVPVGTTKKIENYFLNHLNLKIDKDYFLVFCPERVLPGKIFYELKHNHRIIGGVSQKSSELAEKVYKTFCIGELIITNSETAEMVKLVENSSRDTELAFAYQVASMARKIKLDPYSVIKIANMHPRVNILNPTCGVGGHCLAIDPWFLVETFPEESKLLKLSREINDLVPREVLKIIDNKILDLKNKNKDKKLNISVFGLAYKPDSDDLRESPALEVALNLNSRDDINLSVQDPYVPEKTIKKLGFSNINQDEKNNSIDLKIYLVNHKKFKFDKKDTNLNFISNY